MFLIFLSAFDNPLRNLLLRTGTWLRTLVKLLYYECKLWMIHKIADMAIGRHEKDLNLIERPFRLTSLYDPSRGEGRRRLEWLHNIGWLFTGLPRLRLLPKTLTRMWMEERIKRRSEECHDVIRICNEARDKLILEQKRKSGSVDSIGTDVNPGIDNNAVAATSKQASVDQHTAPSTS